VRYRKDGRKRRRRRRRRRRCAKKGREGGRV